MVRGVSRSLAIAVLLACFSAVQSLIPGCTAHTCPKPAARCPRTWSYDKQEQWGAQCSGWATCSGTKQSPINIYPPVNAPPCTIDASSFKAILPLTLQETYLFNTGNFFAGAPSTDAQQFPVVWNGQRYHFDKFAFHSPSEHVINGKRYDLELQISFKGVDLHYLNVVGNRPADTQTNLNFAVFFQRSAGASVTNQFLEQIIYDLPQFSDCSCGNGRFEDHSNYEFYNPTIGVTEECDNGVAMNSNASRPAGSPNCCRNDCKKPKCGDGVVDWGEACDNGADNKNVPNACRITCCLPTCGDGILDAGEDCDDGNRHNLDGCSSICKFECGDGELNLKNNLEQCDNGANNSNTAPNSCRGNCLNFRCGDYVTDSANNETCDGTIALGIQWPNGIAPSQCRNGCIAARCGDSRTDNNEQCDDGPSNGPNGRCSSTCTLNCGDGVVQAGEQCDLGAANSWVPDAVCRPTCVFAHCGDGIIDLNAGEQCDSVYIPPGSSTPIGNLYCTSTCQQRCGSGLTPVDDSAIQCDHGCYNANGANRCRDNCQKPRCGDGIVDSGETCDNGANNSNSVMDACRTTCVLPKCGDGTVDSGEACDDGNNVAGDGCDPSCRLECGNGNLEASAGEECDWGVNNSNTADACRTNCKLPCCGDGILDKLEECDSGVNNSDTAGNACRKNCRLPYCGDGIIDTANGEKCDKGARNSDTDDFGCSLFCIPNYCRQRKLRNGLNFDLLGGFASTPVYEYSGSQTAPPCTENVKWVVLENPLDMSDFQYSEFTHAKYGLANRARTCQNSNNRAVKRPCTPPTPVCGNGVLEAGEQCDLGFGNSNWEANRCRHDCRNPSCGDGVTDKSEECDDGAAGSSRCTAGCALVKIAVNPFATPAWGCGATCRWSFLSSRNTLCAGDRTNAQQSPINIDLRSASGINPTAGGLPANVYVPDSIKVVNSGRQLVFVPSNTHTLDGANLERIEFHSPSEHTINGKHSDLEAQFIHVKADGSHVALALLYNVGASASPFLSQFDFYVPKFSDCGANNGIIDEGEQCDDGPMNSDVRPGACRTNGKLPSCGDGIVDRGEQCDPGRHPSTGVKNQPYCRADCTINICGDGIKEGHEQCDLGAQNGVATSGCDKLCHLYCGNGLLEGNEQCDNGAANSNSPNVCRTNCRLPTCGDGIRDEVEFCDEGATSSWPNVCRRDCSLPQCGDGVTDPLHGEQCDGGANCNGLCQLICGNGVLDAGEECDLGINANTGRDGVCRANCKLPTCGDGILDSTLGEECEGTAGCANCKLLCGNGIVEAGEQCDQGTLNDDTVPGCCRTNCRNPYCGDGVLDAGEECDFGTNTTYCRTNCKLPRCGDGIKDAEEQCDDGNLVNGDGCSNTCWKECGNGRRDGNEFCDNGAANANLPNQCRPDCTLPRCGDGVVDDGEQCDGPAPFCRADCTIPYCGDGIVDAAFGERCDAGAANSDYKVDGCSTTCTPNSCRSCSPAGRTADLSVALKAFTASPFVRYAGSLTTPPCAESTTWYVATQPAVLSARQAAVFAQGGCPRGVQPANGRVPAFLNTAGAICGNCQVEAGEECDTGDNNANAPNKCKLNCKKPACGDGYVDDGEECDSGAANAAAGPCNLQCRWVRTCPATCAAPPATTTCSANTSGAAQCQSTVNNQGTIIHVNFARLLQGAGCTGPNCANN